LNENSVMAEGVGFEPTEPAKIQRFSSWLNKSWTIFENVR
jgi:hypothetical protein